jgi:hemerythrin-like domain-containing protein
MGAAIEQLMKEHEAIQRMLNIVEKVCANLTSGERVDPEHLKQILEFFRIFADECHHGKEEHVLFPALEEAGIPKEGGPIGLMLNEHNLMRGYVKNFAEAVDRYQAGEPQALSKVVHYATDYVATLRQHIDKENNILFPMAEIQLSDEKQTELAEQFESIETEKIGEGKHENLHAVLEHLEEIYIQS